jgi:hypothetical protein
MRQVYSRSFTHKWATGETTKIYSERVDPGYVLHVTLCFAYSPERDASDDVLIGIKNGGEDITLFAVAPAVAQKGANVDNEFYVGEGDQVFADFEDVEDGDTIGVNINGILMPRADFEKGME